MRPGAPVCVSGGYVHMSHTYTLTHIHMRTRIYTHAHAYTLTDTHINTRTHIHIHVHTHTLTHIHIHTGVCTHADVHGVHTHTHTCAQSTHWAWQVQGQEQNLSRPALSHPGHSASPSTSSRKRPQGRHGALPRHAGAHRGEVPAGAQALVSALRLSSLSGPSSTHLVTLSPDTNGSPGQP